MSSEHSLSPAVPGGHHKVPAHKRKPGSARVWGQAVGAEGHEQAGATFHYTG